MKAWMMIGGAVIGVTATVLAAPMVLPILGGAGLLGAAGTGTAISTLSGAALTSASCAAVTGTITGTTGILGTAGIVLGAALGAVARRFSEEGGGGSDK